MGCTDSLKVDDDRIKCSRCNTKVKSIETKDLDTNNHLTELLQCWEYELRGEELWVLPYGGRDKSVITLEDKVRFTDYIFGIADGCQCDKASYFCLYFKEGILWKITRHIEVELKEGEFFEHETIWEMGK